MLKTVKEGDWKEEKIENAVKSWIDEKGCDTGEVLWPMRVALSGQKNSPGPFEIAGVLGKEKTLSRILKAVNLVQS